MITISLARDGTTVIRDEETLMCPYTTEPSDCGSWCPAFHLNLENRWLELNCFPRTIRMMIQEVRNGETS